MIQQAGGASAPPAGKWTSDHYDAYNRHHRSLSLSAVSRCAVAPTARGATIPCMVLTAKRPRMPPSSGTSTRFATVVTITTAKRASTTSRAGTTTLPTAGSLMRMGSYQLWIFRLSICLLTVVIILSTTLTHLGTFLC